MDTILPRYIPFATITTVFSEKEIFRILYEKYPANL